MSDIEAISTTNATAGPTLAMPLTLAERIDQIFPTLTAAQIARIAAHGRKRQLQPGEVLQEVGAQVRFFLVTAGKIDIFTVQAPLAIMKKMHFVTEFARRTPKLKYQALGATSRPTSSRRYSEPRSAPLPRGNLSEQVSFHASTFLRARHAQPDRQIRRLRAP